MENLISGKKVPKEWITTEDKFRAGDLLCTKEVVEEWESELITGMELLEKSFLYALNGNHSVRKEYIIPDFIVGQVFYCIGNLSSVI